MQPASVKDALSDRVPIVGSDLHPAEVFGSTTGDIDRRTTHLAVFDGGRFCGLVGIRELTEYPKGWIFGDLAARGSTLRVDVRMPVEGAIAALERAGKEAAAVLDERGSYLGAVTLDDLRRRLAEERAADATLSRDSVLTALRTSVIITATDVNGTIVRVSEPICAISGYTRDELIGANHRLLNSGHHPREFWAQMWGTITRGGTWRNEVCNRAKDGSLHWVDTTIAPVRDEAGGIIGYIAARVDITERKRAEAALRESEARFASAFHGNGVAMGIRRLRDGVLIDANEGLARLLGRPREGLIGSRAEEMGLNVEGARQAELLAVETSRVPVMDVEAQVRDAHGDLREVILSVSCITVGGEDCALMSFVDITARRRAERALTRNEERLRLVLDATADGVWDWNIATGEVYYSPRWCRMLGYGPEEVPGRIDFLFSIVHPDDADLVGRVLDRELGGSPPTEVCEARLRCRSGEYLWVYDRSKVVARDSAGRPTRLVGATTDISERRMAEEAVRASERHLQRVLTNVHDAVIVDDVDGRLVYANRGFFQLFGLSDRDARSVVLEDYVSPEWREELRDRHARRVRGEPVPDRFEYQGLRADGTRVWLETRVIPVVEHGRIVGTQSAIRDISERKRAEAAIEQSRAQTIANARRLRDMIDGCFGFIGLYDLEGTLIEANRAPLEAGGLTRDEVIGRPFWDTYWWSFSPEVQATLRDALRRAAAGETVRYETPVRVRNDGRIVIDVTFGPLHDPQGAVTGIVGFGVDVTDRKRSESALLAEQAFTNAVLENAGALVVVLDAEGRIRRYSREAERVSGYSFAEVEGRFPWEILLPPEQAEAVRVEAFEAAMRGPGDGATTHYTNEWVTRDGRRRLLEWRNTRLHGPDGEPLFMVSIGIDVTDRRSAESALRESEARFRTIFEADPECIKLVDAECRLIDMNPAGLALIEADSIDQVRGMSVTSVVVPEHRERFRSSAAEVFGTGGPRVDTFEILGLRGTRRWMEQHAVGLRDPDDPTRVVRMLAVTRDITGRVRAEETIRQSQDRLLEAQRVARIGSWELDIPTGALTWSDTIYEIFEIDRTRFGATYEAFLDAIHPDDRDMVHGAYTTSVRNRTPYDIVHRLRMPDGRVKHVHERCATYSDEHGSPRRSVGTVQDITERVQAEAQLNEASRREALAILTGGIAHEFNSVLLAASTHLHGSSAAAEASVAKAAALIQQAQSLSASLLELFAAGEEEERATPHPLAVGTWLPRCARQLADVLPRGARLALGSIPEDLSARADPLALEQVLRILMTNAVDATAGCGEIRVRATSVLERKADGPVPGVEIRVSDDGPGVPERDRDRVFEPFFTTKSRARRSGLGLAIASRLIEQQGGALAFEPNEPRGSTFVIRLRAGATSGAAPAAERDPTP